MTFGIRNIIGIHRLHTGQKNYSAPLIFKTYAQWSYWQRKAFDYLIWCHLGHALDFIAALLSCEFILYSFWHWMTYARMIPYPQGPSHEKKFNPVNPYEEKGQHHLLREITFTTLGWLQSAFVQCIFMWLWASGRLPYYSDFWSRPFFSIFILLGIHRLMHPWWSVLYGLREVEIQIHGLDYQCIQLNIFFYYTCAYFPLLFSCHPLHFLYAKFHADIAPIGGHDGYDDPAGGSGFHYLHHALFECNYGVSLIDFDRLFGTYKEYVKKPSETNTSQD
ncbi:unnamed protein product [Rotaria sordida]|uniref:Fatty acid hydroxylase domain-containing protein n=1 Tax=Rotaria sordida TaxID=392033 RepID=A0A819CTX6_9BILA|nr:unnamed protein product [Rotaria sordida]CAF1363101.1 unnamed protein product [Rotaria sordida]CAF1561329.1 unnamed protein product [Rotaria sordida]CAF3823753.1 unnamed protein product [Rotaria sordida]